MFTMFSTGNGGTIELLYTQVSNEVWNLAAVIYYLVSLVHKRLSLLQTYSPMTLSTARDFWTLRYTTNLDNGSIVVSIVVV